MVVVLVWEVSEVVLEITSTAMEVIGGQIRTMDSFNSRIELLIFRMHPMSMNNIKM